MKIEIANRLENINEYYFSKKLQEIATLNANGFNIINLGIGSPDLAPHNTVISTLTKFANQNNTHSYQSYKGIPEFRAAISSWYQTFYNVSLNPDCEILPLMGSKEGIMHICMTYLNENDAVLIPNPGYPTYASAAKIAGALIYDYNLNERNNWEPNFTEIEQHYDLSKVKLMFVNYPNMPTGKKASKLLFEKIIYFAHKHQILIINDNPYSFIGNTEPLSILAIPNAKEVAIELNSLSKSMNMAGWRIGMVCGNAQHISNILRFKSNMDSGMFFPIQMAAIQALSLTKDWYEELNLIYAKRKLIVLEILDCLKCTYQIEQHGLFVWAKVDTTIYKDGFELSDALLYKQNVFVTPGGIFGSNGNNYIRISLCTPEHLLNAALKRIKNED
jgi:LL-diaminopimelate aminotransferase